MLEVNDVDMTTLLNFVSENGVALVFMLFFFIIIVVFRECRLIKKVILEAIVTAETKLNGQTGQAKLDYVVTTVGQKLPKWVSIFVTKKMIVDIVEESLNFVSAMYKLEHEVDIKGNEDEV